jgi:hypothetical protein
MNQLTPAMLQAGLQAGAHYGVLHLDCDPCLEALPAIWNAMETARLEGERAIRQEATAARAKANHPWPVKGGAS